MDSFEQRKLLHLSRGDLFCQTNQCFMFLIYFTNIVEATFALDGNSYITKWLIGMYLKNTGEIRRFERSSFVRKLVLRREVCLLTPRRRALARNVEFPLYFPRTSIPINQVLLLLPLIIYPETVQNKLSYTES